MAATENYRVSTCMAALEATIQRIELLAVNRADSDDEITELVSVRNS